MKQRLDLSKKPPKIEQQPLTAVNQSMLADPGQGLRQFRQLRLELESQERRKCFGSVTNTSITLGGSLQKLRVDAVRDKIVHNYEHGEWRDLRSQASEKGMESKEVCPLCLQLFCFAARIISSKAR